MQMWRELFETKTYTTLNTYLCDIKKLMDKSRENSFGPVMLENTNQCVVFCIFNLRLIQKCWVGKFVCMTMCSYHIVHNAVDYLFTFYQYSFPMGYTLYVVDSMSIFWQIISQMMLLMCVGFVSCPHWSNPCSPIDWPRSFWDWTTCQRDKVLWR